MGALHPLLIEKREEILAAARDQGAVNVRVFGSAARGDYGPDSDFDFLIDCGPVRPPFFPGGAQHALQELLGRKVDVVTEAALHPKIRARVLREAVAL